MGDPPLVGRSIHVSGVVQGVGFRPFVYGLATRLGLTGWVINTSAGVDIHIQGPPDHVDVFVDALVAEAPPLARIDALIVEEAAPDSFEGFEIRASEAVEGAFQPISPDMSICPDCLRELFDRRDRRYRYPFINCTNCGPRFTIIKDIPYDRPNTTMAVFPMCEDCAREYHDPADRRFHAQPVACPVCGPRVWLVTYDEVMGEQGPVPMPVKVFEDEAIRETLILLRLGRIVAIKGLGGFHLACDARNEEAVSELRRRKLRRDKPFALMMRDVAQVEQYCIVSEAERALLESRERPIVLLEKRRGGGIAAAAAPGQTTLGVMLPYTPLHYLLFDGDNPMPLIMTSGNLAEEPIATDNKEALERLADLADAFLLHDRDIHIRTDDSVMRVFRGAELPVRRSRGYAPYPVRLPFSLPPLLAVGGELKNTFCVTRDQYAFLSHHIGDMENLETVRSFEQGVTHFETLFRISPQAIACDMHPNYMATRYAQQRAEREGLPLIRVQHHHAHVAAVMAENGHPGDRPVIGVAFDGTGYGTDGAIWGGEFLIATYAAFERAAHLKYVPLPGGDAAARRTARAGITHLLMAGLALEPHLPPVAALGAVELNIVRQQVERGLNAPPTSSMGRLFDAVAAIIGVREEVNYEGQAAIELEALVEPDEIGFYPFGTGEEIDASPAIRAVVLDFEDGVPQREIAARFHNGVALMIRNTCLWLRDEYGLSEVALSGGVFQNVTLLGMALDLLHAEGFTALTHRLVPPNDGGLALGQAVVAGAVLG